MRAQNNTANTESQSPTPADAARAYKARGWVPIPLRPGDKAAKEPGWQTAEIPDDAIDAAFANGENVGVVLGQRSGGLMDADLDDAGAARMAPRFLPPTEAVFGRAGKPHSHPLYLVGDDTTSERFRDPIDGATLAELRGDGRQTMFPPSTHPSGERVEWTADGEPGTTSRKDLRERLGWLCTAAFLVKHWGEWAHQRHSLTLALAGGMLGGGKPVDGVEGLVRLVCHETAYHRPDDLIRGVRDTARALESDPEAKVTGWPTVAGAIGSKAVASLCTWLGIRADRGGMPLTDLGNAERMAAQHGDDLRYCADARTWYAWDRTR